MTIYNVKSTRKSKAAIQVPENEIVDTIAVKLFGRKKLAYGKDLNENLLHLLESFACSADPENQNAPDTTAASGNMFDNPVEGQLWFNRNNASLYVYDGVEWQPQQKFGEIAANWGIIADGEQIPLPISSTGRTFTYSECSWIVTPHGYPNTIDYMTCRTDGDALVTMEYSLENDPELISGFANYLIVGIPGNVNQGNLAPEVSMTATPTPTPTPTITKTSTPTPTPTKAATPTPTPTKTMTPTPSASAAEPSASPTPTPSQSPGASPPPVSVTPTPTPTTTVTPTPSPSSAPDFSITVTQGDGSQYGGGLVLFATNTSSCSGFCGAGDGFAPYTVSDIDRIGITLVGGVAPYTLVVDTWQIDPSSTNTMYNEFLEPRGNFSGVRVEGNPLSNPTWTWSGGSVGGRIILSAVGKCAYGDKNVTGSAVIRATDNVGQVATYSFGWSMERDAASGDGSCGSSPPPDDGSFDPPVKEQ